MDALLIGFGEPVHDLFFALNIDKQSNERRKMLDFRWFIEIEKRCHEAMKRKDRLLTLYFMKKGVYSTYTQKFKWKMDMDKIKTIFVVSILQLVSVQVSASVITVGGFNLDTVDFADVVTFWDGSGTLEPGNIILDPGTGSALTVGDAVLGSNVDMFLNGVNVELGFLDNVLTNNVDAFDVLIFEIGEDGDGFSVGSSEASLSVSFDGSERIITGFNISSGGGLTAYLIDLADLGVATGASISSIFLNGGGLELAAVAGVSIALPDSNVSPISEPPAIALILTGLISLGLARRKRKAIVK